MSALPNLTRVLINASRGNAKIWGNVSLPKGSSSGTESFGPAQKMLLARRGSVAQPGDTVIDLGDRFVLGYFSRSANDEIFRMYRTPFTADVMRIVNDRDPVTGFDRSGRPTKVGFASFDRKVTGMAPDFGDHKRTNYRILTGFELEVNDIIDGLKVTSVTRELGVTLAEAE